MKELSLTPSEKEVIRALPCSLCLAVPPFADGSRCHPHRIIRGRDGGQYVASNVVPLCPPCHREIDRVVMITAALKGAAAAMLCTTPEQRKASARKAAAARTERKRRIGLTPNELAHCREMSARIPPDVRRANGLKGGNGSDHSHCPAARSARIKQFGLTKAERAAYQKRRGQPGRNPYGLDGAKLAEQFKTKTASQIAREIGCNSRTICNRIKTHLKTKADFRALGRSGRQLREACVNGHPFDAANTYVFGKNHRICRTCRRNYMRAYSARRRAR